MMQPELLQPSWPFYGFKDSAFDQVEFCGLNMDVHLGGPEISFSFTAAEYDSDISSSAPYFATLFSSEFDEFAGFDGALRAPLAQLEDFSLEMGGFDSILSGEIEGVNELWDKSEGSFPSQELSMEGGDAWSPCASMKSSESSTRITSIQPELFLPGEGMEIDKQVRLFHLLTAHGEAMEKEQMELAEVIMKCISESVNPIGEALERVAFNLFQDVGKQGEYLQQESCKNFDSAFKLFYQMFPYGRFAHFATNSAILEAIPGDAETVHIVDFDMGEGVQWPPAIEAIAEQRKALKLTSIKWGQDSRFAPSQVKFEETKRRLCSHARSVGLKLIAKEIEIEDLVSEIKKTKKRGGRREWLAFNCMVGLPHMRRGRSKREAMDFVRVAKDLIANSANIGSSNRGILIIGDGDAGEKLKNCSSYGSFHDGQLEKFRALYESMERNFPTHLAEARIAIESLFLSPNVSLQYWFQKWEEMREGYDLQAGIGLEGWRLSRDNIAEAREIVREGDSSYRVRIEGQNENELVLEWTGTALLRVSAWR